jgi:Tfp pilus assembly protein PilV
MVAIMTVLIFMIVISLIALGFAQMSQRNQQDTFNNQLSAQAFYAAESGINDVRQLISTAIADGKVVPDKTACGPTGSGPEADTFYSSLQPTLNAGAGVSYSCIEVSASPTTLNYTDVGSNASVIVPVISDGAAISSINLTVESKTSSNPLIGNCSPGSTPAGISFPSVSGWSCGYGVLRFDLVPVSGSSLNLNGLESATMTTFAIPVGSGGQTSIAYSGGSAKSTIGMQCANDSSGCSLTITGLSQTSYYLRVSSLYQDMSLQVTANDSSGNAIGLSNAQALIDSTGRADEVLRRLQVTVPLTPSSNDISDYAIQSTDSICKRFAVMDGFFYNAASAGNSTNPLCQPSP